MKERRLLDIEVDRLVVRRLYETAFPAEEQIPWDDLMRLVEEMPLDFTVYDDDGVFVGFTIVYPRQPFNWFWYFAVRDELRGSGYGQRILTRLLKRYSDSTNILDMESPDQPCGNAVGDMHFTCETASATRTFIALTKALPIPL